MDKDPQVLDKKGHYHGNLEQFAYDHLNYYQCAMC
jgi:hypothetical protein